MRRLKLLIPLLACLFIPLAVNAQITPPTILAVDFNKAQFAWTWAQGTGGPVEFFVIRCGGTTGGPYLTENIIRDPAARTLPVKNVVGPGVWFCVAVSGNQFGESSPSGEISFKAGTPPDSVTDFKIQAQ